MATPSRSWIREYAAQCAATATETVKAVRIYLFDGELDGRVFELYQWPPPERIWAGDLETYAVGSYILESSVENRYYYRCRVNDDYVRIRAGKLRNAVAMARRKLIRR